MGRERSQERNRKTRAKQIQEHGVGNKDGRAQGGPEPFRSGTRINVSQERTRMPFLLGHLYPSSAPPCSLP